MPSNSPVEYSTSDTILRLSTSSTQSVDGDSKNVGKFIWPSGATYEGEFSCGCRNGKGRQTWQDGSVYEGDFVKDMRHGTGQHKWQNGEVYEGKFFKDHRHGFGCYKWPDGTSYTGTFYLDKKEGYGTFQFANGDLFEGLYKEDERFGPGVLTYSSTTPQCQDVGIWHREKLFRLCITAKNVFSMKEHPEYEYFPEENHAQIDMSSDFNNLHDQLGKEAASYTFLSDKFKSLIVSENTALPPGIESYSKDFEHLPQTLQHKQELDKAFFGSKYDLVKNDDLAVLVATNNTSIHMQIQKHIYKHRLNADCVKFNVKAVISGKRLNNFGSKSGIIEEMSIALIEQAGLGNFRQVYSILKSGLVDANVMDCKGSGALLEAAINCHHKVVNLLLDCGANVNQVTDEAVSALSACHVFYYPIDHFKYNIAEKYVQNHRRSEEKEKRGRPRSPAIDLLMRNRRRSSSSGERKRRRSSQSPDRASPDSLMSRRKTIASPERLRIAGREKLTPSPVNMGETEAIETCKSDLKIKKVFRDIMSAKSQGRSSEAKSFNFDPAVDDVSSVDAKSQHTSKDDLTFESNVNMVEYNLQVSEHLIERTATLLSHNLRAVSGISTRDGTAIRLGTAAALAVWKSEHKQLESMMHLLMKRGADPNIGSVPFPCLFFAVKAGDVDAVRVLLQHGASTNCRLSDKLGGLTPLHIASGIRCSEGVPIVELLLHASANPNTPAHDEDISRATGTGGSESGASEKLVNQFKWMETGTQWVTQGLKFVEESGRTPLHIACDRDDNYREAREIANLLLDNGANPDVIWNGYSPLALAIASGNDFCIDELLHFGADGSLPLTRGIGSALCVASNPKHEHRRTPEGRIRVIDKLVNAGANILVPVTYGSKELTGTVVDYAHWMFFRDSRIAHTPYHALSVKERETYNARKRLLSHLGSLLRHAAVLVERERLKQETHYGIKSQSPSRDGRFLYTGAGADIAVTSNLSTPQTYSNQEAHGLSWGNTAVSRVSFVRPGYHEQTDDRSAGVKSAMDSSREAKETSKSGKKKKRLQSGPIRKPLFRYCYDCGRSVGVRLTSCSRCHEVFYCSRACKLKAWEERHKDECLRIKVYREQSPLPTPSEIAALFADRQLDETIERANLKTTSIVDTILNQHLTVAEENALILSRKPMFGSRGTTNRWTRSRGRDSSNRRAQKAASGRSGRTTHTSNTKSHSSPTRQSMAKVGSKTRRKVGKEVEFGTTGLTLHELGITENYSFN